MHALVNAFAAQDLRPLPFGRAEQPAADPVGHDAIDLLGHLPERAQAGLDMGDRDVELGRGNRAGQRRVGVAIDKNRIRLFAQHNALERDNHAARSFRRAMPPWMPSV